MASKNWEEAKQRLKTLREGQCRESEEVVDLWEQHLQANRHHLTDEIWPIYEQVCIAACDCGRDDIASECVRCLSVQFPKSTRVKVLRGMRYEATAQFEKAESLYSEIEEKEPENTVIKKRRIAMLKEQNKIKEAIASLNKYLKDFMADVEAWGELSELYLCQHDYSKAAFCLEEMIIFNPNCAAFHCKYAEIKYSEGRAESVEVARKYFAQALRMDRHNMRALFGFYLSANSLASSQSSNKADNLRYAEWATQQIQARYQEAGEQAGVEAVDAMLAQMKLSPAP